MNGCAGEVQILTTMRDASCASAFSRLERTLTGLTNLGCTTTHQCALSHHHPSDQELSIVVWYGIVLTPLLALLMFNILENVARDIRASSRR
jgi:hypothetical protein